jgi:hypothetical protein
MTRLPSHPRHAGLGTVGVAVRGADSRLVRISGPSVMNRWFIARQ